MLQAFLNGVASITTLGWPLKDRFPFDAPGFALSDDWRNIGQDIYFAINAMESNNEQQNESP